MQTLSSFRVQREDPGGAQRTSLGVNPLLKTLGTPTISIPKETFEFLHQVLSGFRPPPLLGNSSVAVPALEPVFLPQLSVQSEFQALRITQRALGAIWAWAQN